ncbi:hypothetical protein HPB50_021084 [Hyalomma asiaticum]|uniref:Uncharacterized protein n=1 Tax=Hyalomma asiaticum TaxID=266040 RepID=A0ACB7SAH4_HYAAI|nr:hypothetical protein HPB50_021084 [Hyalomma asiaticum]
MDEPTVGLDPETRRGVWTVVKELRGKASILLSTHDMEEADILGDRIIVMYSGSVICWGSPSFLKNACGAFLISVLPRCPTCILVPISYSITIDFCMIQCKRC